MAVSLSKNFDLGTARLGQEVRNVYTQETRIVSHVIPAQGESDTQVRLRDAKGQTIMMDDPSNYVEVTHKR